MARTLITVPPVARRGELIEIRTLIAHPMETGYRPGADGQLLPRDLIRHFVCRWDGVEIFRAELHAAVAANPSLSFHTLALASGTLSFEWRGDHGFAQVETVAITVT